MAHGLPLVQDPTQQGHSLHEPRILDQAIRVRGHRHRLQTFLTTVCRFNHFPRNYQLTMSSTQTKLPIPDLHPGTDPLKMNLSTQTHTVTTTVMPTVEHPFQQEPSAMIWMENPVLPRSRRPRDAIPRHQRLSSPHLQSPANNTHDPREVETQRLPNEPRKSPSHSLQYPPTTSRSTRATMKTKRASRATVTVTKSVSARWLLATMTRVRVNGSICRVWA